MRVSSPEAGPMVIGRTYGPRSGASGPSFAFSTRPSTRSKTTSASGTAGRSQPKSTGGSTLSRGLLFRQRFDHGPRACVVSKRQRNTQEQPRYGTSPCPCSNRDEFDAHLALHAAVIDV